MNGETSHNLHQDFSATLRIFCPDAAGKYTVPVLWDKKENTIVNNESSEIMRMFNRLALLVQMPDPGTCFLHQLLTTLRM